MTYKTPNLKFYREFFKLTQEELAEKSKVCRTTINRLESGKSSYKPQIELIAQSLGISIDFLVSKEMNCVESDFSEFDALERIVNKDSVIVSREPNSILTIDQERRVQYIASVFSEVKNESSEDLLVDFKRDMHPENEIRIWENLAHAYTIVNRIFLLSIETKKEVFGYLIHRSQNSKRQMKNFSFKYLNAKIINTIESHYKHRATPLVVQNKNGEFIPVRII